MNSPNVLLHGILYGTCETSHDYKLDSQYKISDCTFESNRANTSNPEKSSFVKLVGVKKLIKFQGLGRGGGLAIRILGSASRNRISIVDCKFYHNQALSGGGLNIKIIDEAKRNSVKIISSRFAHNTCDRSGGGINIGLRQAAIQNNVVRGLRIA